MLAKRIEAKIRRITDLGELEQFALEIKGIALPRVKEPERASWLSLLNSRREELRARARPERPWHTAPDGTPCCCTADDRRYGCGCR